MRYLFASVGAFLLSICLLVVRFKTGWVEGFWPHFAELILWVAVALVLAKTGLRQGFRRVPANFREIVIILGMVFPTIVANASIQLLQKTVFGRTYVASYQDPVSQPGSTRKPVVQTVAEKTATNFASVTSEEIISRWIILGTLLMVMPAGWAIAVSSLMFASLHTVIPIVGGMPEIGLFRLGSTGVIGISCGIAFVRHGLAAAIAIHFLVNLVGWFAYNQTYIATTVILSSAAVTVFVLPLTLWFTRRQRRENFTRPAILG